MPERNPNKSLQYQRDLRGWSQQRVAEELGTTGKNVGRWERGESVPDTYYREKLCLLFEKTALELGFINQDNAEDASSVTLLNHDNSLVLLDQSARDRLDASESITILAWETWFASRPKQAAREISKLLPGLDAMAHALPLAIDRLRAKELSIRCHGLLVLFA